MKTAAFFDLDHTLISRATPLALARTFHRRRLIRRRDLVRAAAWHLIFLVRGLGEEAVRKGAEDGMVLLKGIPVAEIEEMIGDAMERVLCPLVYAEPIDLLGEHRAKGEPAYVLSASLHEIVAHIADELGFDGASARPARSSTASTPARPAALLRQLQSRRAARAGPARGHRPRRARPPTPTRTPTWRSSRRSATRWPSTPTSSCARSRSTAAGRSSPSRSGCGRRSRREPARRLTIGGLLGAGAGAVAWRLRQ